MEYALPLAMMFGFLTLQVRHGEDFAVVMTAVLGALVLWSFVAVLREGSRSAFARTGALVLAGVFVTVLCGAARVGVNLLGTLWGASVVAFALVWSACVLAIGAIVVRVTHGVVSRLVATGAIASMTTLVVLPGLFYVGVLGYAAHTIFAGTTWTAFAWVSASIVGGVACAWMLGKGKESAFPLGGIGGALLLVGYATGACIAAGAWFPAVLGLVAVQAGFRAMHYL